MIAHTNRGRITVDPKGAWRLYTLTVPPDSTVVGVIARGLGDRGALVRINRTGEYVQVNAGAVRSLPQNKVIAAVRAATGE